MAEESYRKWDLVLKGLGAIGLVAGAAIGLIEYYFNWTQAVAIEASKLDSDQHKLYFDKQLERYLDVTDTVAGIATTHDQRKREELIQHFDTLYYGSMVMLEHRGDEPDSAKSSSGEKYSHDANVEGHMIAVHKCLHTTCSDGDLQQQSLALADACRNALSISWAERVKNLTQSLAIKRRDEDK